MRVYEAHPGLYFSQRTHVLADDEVEPFLREHRPDAVYNFWHTPDQRVASRVGYYTHRSLPDGRLVGDRAGVFEATAEEVAGRVLSGERVLLHCYGGRNRACLTAALALVRLRGIAGREALEHIRGVRPKSLFNAHFAQYLEERA